jgi:hypothetical protein
MIKNLENFNKLRFNFEYKNRLIRTNFDDNEYFKFDTPFLKVLKPIHSNTNRKKNTEKNYIILEILDNYNVNHELDDFLILINKLHEISQENIKKNSIKWFNTEFDEIGLDMKVKKPIDKQKDKQFIKILIPNDNKELFEKIRNLNKNDYVMSSIFYKGLKVSNEYLTGEYELINLITQEEYEQNNQETNQNSDSEILHFIENQLEEENQPEEMNEIEEVNQLEGVNQTEKMNEVEEVNQPEEMNEVEEVNQTEEMNEDELEVNNDRKNKINIESIENNSVTSQSTKEKKSDRFIKLVRRKTKSLIFI